MSDEICLKLDQEISKEIESFVVAQNCVFILYLSFFKFNWSSLYGSYSNHCC